MRSDVVFDAIGEMVKTRPDSLAMMKHAWAGTRDTLAMTHRPIKELLMMCASRLMAIPRIKKDMVPGIHDPDDVVLKRAGWVTAYWNSVEHREEMSDFGFVPYFG